MKYRVVIIAFIAVVFSACNGGNSSVPAYTTTKNADSSTADRSTTIVAPTEPGREVFEARFEACHGQNGSARNNNAANLQFSRLDSLSITETIKNGRGVMPPFKDAIADSDIAHLAIYVKSLRR